MRVPFLVILAAFLLAACGQSEPPAKGKTAARPHWSARSRMVRLAPAPADRRSESPQPCDQAACGASCGENEQILNAYALNPGGAIGFIDERNVTFRPKERPVVLALACISK